MNVDSNKQFQLTKHRALCANAASVHALRNAMDCGCYRDSANSRWYCIQSNRQSEFAVLSQIGEMGIRAHLPTFVAARERIKPRPLPKGTKSVVPQVEQIVDVIRPLFTGYLFAKFDVDRDDWKPLFRTIGVKQLFMASYSRPKPVPSGVVEALIAKGRPGDGVIDDAYLGPTGPIVRPGQRVRITSGPFADLAGICTMSSQKRITMLLEAMDGASVEVDRANVVGA